MDRFGQPLLQGQDMFVPAGTQLPRYPPPDKIKDLVRCFVCVLSCREVVQNDPAAAIFARGAIIPTFALLVP